MNKKKRSKIRVEELVSGVTRSSSVSNTNNLLICNVKNIFQYRSFSKSSTTGLFLTLSVLAFCAFNSFGSGILCFSVSIYFLSKTHGSPEVCSRDKTCLTVQTGSQVLSLCGFS